jgi:2-methylcitrate dehydratase
VTLVEDLADFVVKRTFDDLSSEALEQLKIRILDALGCALGALGAGPAGAVRWQVDDFGGRPLCTMIGGGRSAPDRVALYNGALVRYLDFNDSYLAPGETCHPSDNLAPILAACEYEGASGRDLLAALAVAYQVQCRLSDEAPVRAKGFDHTTQGAYAAAAGVAKALGLDRERTAHAIAIAGAAYNALRVTRTGALSNWKGLASPNAGFGATHAAFLAMRGVTGPLEVFEGNKGFMEAIAGPFEIDWASEDLERVRRTILKRYNAEIHSQSAIEGLLELRTRHGFRGEDVDRIEADVFDVAFHIIGGGEEGDKKRVHTKEEADHSLPYLLAVAALDGQVLPEQFSAGRISARDVQSLLRHVEIRPAEVLSRLFPNHHASRVRVILADGRRLSAEKRDYEGFHTHPMQWGTVREKFDRLAASAVPRSQLLDLAQAVAHLEEIEVSDLTAQLARVGSGQEFRSGGDT